MTKEEVFARLVESRQALHQAIQGLSEKDMSNCAPCFMAVGARGASVNSRCR